MSGAVAVIRGFDPNPKQLAAARACADLTSRVVILDGAIRAGKTQAAARLLVEMAIERPATYLVGRATYRSLRDSTMKAMVYGDGALPPLIPPEVVEQVRLSDELVRLKNGAEILFRSLEETAVSKILNLSLGGILVDQIEELDGGDGGERMYDTLLGRLSDPRGYRKLIAVANPSGLTSWQYRRLINEKTCDPFVRRVHFTLRDNAANLPADYIASMEATRVSRPNWFRSFILGEWGAFEGQAFPEFEEAIHVVEPFEIPDAFDVFESLDHGASNPTAFLRWAADHDGNLVVFDEYYSPGLVSKHAPEILRRRAGRPGVVSGRDWIPCYADPSTGAKHGGTDRWGQPASIKSEYQASGIRLDGANNDRAAGYMRLLELLHVDPTRIAPPWATLPAHVVGAPRLYVVGQRCPNLVEQLKSAPIAVDGGDAGECVDPKWATSRGHACDAARYGAMSWKSPSERPDPMDALDPRERAIAEYVERLDNPTFRDTDDAWAWVC